MSKKIQDVLQEINALIKTHKDFLLDNPNILNGIYERLSKATDDEANKWLQDNDPNYTEGDADPISEEYTSGDLESPEAVSGEIDAQDEDTAYVQNQPVEYQDINDKAPAAAEPAPSVPAPSVEPEQPAAQEARPVSRSGYQDWQPQTNYKPEHQDVIQDLTKQGYSPREAERLANAYEGPTTFEQALTHRVRPSEMSPKMMGELKELAEPWLSNARRVSYSTADAEKNPVKYAKGKSLKAHEGAMEGYSAALEEFRSSEEFKQMSPRERHKAANQWNKDYHESNPDHRDNVAAVANADVSTRKEAKDLRQDYINDHITNLVLAGKSGEEETVSDQAAAQHVGGVQNDEGGYSANIQKDPAAVFAEANPEYVAQEKQKLQDRLSQASSDQLSRLKNIDNAARHQNVTRTPKIKGGKDAPK